MGGERHGTGPGRAYVLWILVLAALWGASFMFIKVAVDEIEPTAMMAARLLLAGAILLAILIARTGLRVAAAEVRAAGYGAFVLGAINGAVPFTLIAWGEKHVDSGIAGIANASVPIFVALLALRFRASERVTGLRLAGIVVGILGVAVLAGLDPEGTWWTVAGTLAVVVASLSYASALLYTQHRYPEAAPLVLATASTLAGAVVLWPLAAFQLPREVPSWEALGSVAALAVLATVIGILIYFRMLAAYGASRTSLVTYLLPPFAVFYGVVLLGEPLTLNAVLGLALILVGVALGSGVVRLPRREPVAATPRA
ncbi:MAG TPA: DMT family transporter [Gaiellaceae bacterium]|nr:DMT family transporter [Gaiellaceae bacterium]